MGPPLKAAENAIAHNYASAGTYSFNGAAAKSSGKSRTAAHADLLQAVASMGPPLKAAENSRKSCQSSRSSPGFNGAAAKSSGKWAAPVRATLETLRFNGAAAKSSGKSAPAPGDVVYVVELQWGRR